MRSRLTSRKLRAIVEALLSRTAGEIDLCDESGELRLEDYEAALLWALEMESRRRRTG
jgi:hypothetical protein